MKLIILTAFFVAVVAAAPPVQYPSSTVKAAQILESEYDLRPDGSYNFKYKSDDGISREEVAQVKEVQGEDNKPTQILSISGYYVYPGVDGPEEIKYTADENGFHPEGKSIPQASR